MKRLNLSHYIIIGLVLLLIGGYIWYKRDKQSILEAAEKIVDKEKKIWEKERDSLQINFSNKIEEKKVELENKQVELDTRKKQVDRVRRLNYSLNNKLKDYEKNLIYANRSLDDALNILSKYEYKGDTKSTKEN